MKNFSLIFILLLFGITVNANHNYGSSDLNLKLWNNSDFMVVFDGQSFNVTNNLYLTDLKAGNHSLEVIKFKKNKYGHGGFKQVLYSGSINIPNNSEVTATVSQHRSLNLALTKKYNNYHDNGSNDSQHIHKKGIGCHEYYGCVSLQIMREKEFNQLLSILDDATFDSSKLNIMKQVLLTNNFNVEQVSILANQFTFDSNKLSFAKLAYAKTLDKQNYFLLSNVFTFSSSIKNLNDYINQFG